MLTKRMAERGGDYQAILQTYEATGFAYWRAYPDEARKFGIDSETFGMAFISRDYIRSHWTKWFEVRDFMPAAPNWQDLTILVKPA